MTQEKASFEDDPLYESFFKAFESHLFNPLRNRDEDAFAFLLVNSQDIRPNHGKLQEMFRHCYETEFPSDPELIRVLLKALGIEHDSRPSSPLADHPFGQILHTVSLDQIEQHILGSFKAAVLEVKASHQSEGRMEPIEVGPSEEESTPDLDIKSEGGERFNPTKYGGKELCIAVSYHKDRFRNLRRVALGMKNKANIRYDHGYPDPLTWYQENPTGFTNHLWKLRKKARDNNCYASIPSNYYRKYVG